ncbi:hypothetical protein BDZ94DRAFT_163083 [Collybia nuda]|uniref:Uncharacterized protein n=1 Tax=Collybia nuda TaxID=64659 RepID=A0A9P5XVK9_9AGAR|nr:hypothetical protein BDZ94DRAFT_163083 [Collybia nuda]
MFRNEVDIPDPGPPPREEVPTFWAPVIQFLRKPNPEAKLDKARDRARWAWSNFARHDKVLRQAQISTPELDKARKAVETDHQAFMDVYEAAITETSKKKRKDKEERLTMAAAKLQFRSLHFSKTTIDELSAQAGGRLYFPKRGPHSAPAGAQDHIAGPSLTRRNHRYERMHSLDGGDAHLMSISSELSEDIAMQPLHNM